MTKAEFLPNLYVGSGAGYTYGLPETPGGRPPEIVSLTYTQDIFNGPLRGLERQQTEEAKGQRIALDDTRNLVMARVASAYLELVKVHHSLELLRKEKDSADKIVDVTQQRQSEGFELPTEVTKAQLTRAPDKMLGHAAHIARGLVRKAREGRAFRFRLDDAAQGATDKQGIVDGPGGGRELAHGDAEPGAPVHLFARLYEPTGLGQLAVNRHPCAVFGMKNVLPRLSEPAPYVIAQFRRLR